MIYSIEGRMKGAEKWHRFRNRFSHKETAERRLAEVGPLIRDFVHQQIPGEVEFRIVEEEGNILDRQLKS